MRLRAPGCLLLAWLILASSAGAQGGDPETTVVQELVVTATRPGPAWWTVTRGDSTVWVLGIPEGLPKRIAWDRGSLVERLSRSRMLILPPAGTAGLGDIWGLFAARAKMKGGADLEQRAPPAVKARFLAAVARLGKSPRAYDHSNGVLAGMTMSLDFRHKLGIDFQDPQSTILREARRRHVPVSYAARYPILPVIRASVREVTPAIEWTCLDAAADEIDGGPTLTLAAAEGWANGRTQEALRAGRGFERCVNAVPAGAEFWRRATTDDVTAIVGALRTPGHVIAVVGLRSLLADGGVLDRLRHAGYEVRGDD